nr:hypothetical protein [Actinomycetota bacterium]
MKPRRRDVAFFIGLAFAFAIALVWLLLGIAPMLVSIFSSWHGAFHRWGEGVGALAEIARNIALTSHNEASMAHAAFDFVFSAINLGLAAILVRLKPRELTARLLALGMIGTAVAFNLQAHDALQVVPVSLVSELDVIHVLIHVLSGLSYLFALYLFPDGRLIPRNPVAKALQVPLIGFLALVFTALSLFTTDDHTFGLVVVFGVLIPIVGVAAQLARYVPTKEPATRKRSRLVLGALLVAIGVALPLVLTTGGPSDDRGRTLTYEVQPLPPGTYFFRCDPHPDDMVGVLSVVDRPASPTQTVIEARDNAFDTRRLTLAADVTTRSRFTNFDAELHNVAIYEDETAAKPIFIGAEFSGIQSAVVSFRIFRVIFLLIPLALFVALVRFHLWDIDRIINRTLVYSLVVGAITLVYLAIVVGLGALVGAGNRVNVLLTILFTGIAGLVFQPLRQRARRLANRLIYGRRATPYELLSEFSGRVGETYAPEEVLPVMARTLAEGTGASRAEVWLRVGSSLMCSATWPNEVTGEARRVELDDGRLPERLGSATAVAVMHHGQLLGALTVTKSPGERVTPVEERLLAGLAGQAGLVLKNAQLTAELSARIEELRASRQRIVAAQDAERKRIERDIHDGAQQQLIAMGMKARSARELAAADPGRAEDLLEEIVNDSTAAVQALRDLARGIYPPILAHRGLGSALEAHARRCPVTVKIESDGISRYASDIENALYFCCLEAIQNGMKHGRGPLTVTLRESDDSLRFDVVDRGPGFQSEDTGIGSGMQNMADRLSALGGKLEIATGPEGGASVSGRVPL